MYSHSDIHICIYSHSYIFIYVYIHIYIHVYMNENSILNTQAPVSPFVEAWNPYQSCGLGELGACPLCLPHTPCLSLCRTWQRKRGKLPQSQVQGLAAKLLVGREARAAPWHLAGSPAPPLRKDLVQRRPPAKLAAFFFPADPQPGNPTSGPG